MESNEERQQAEITVLKAIYSTDFTQPPPPTAWKTGRSLTLVQAATRLPEFIIKVSHPSCPSKVNFQLNVKYVLPRTYPAVASPTLAIQKPVYGLTHEQVTKLTQALHEEMQKHRGLEMIMELVTFAQDWLETYATPPAEVVGSLATQMNKRAMHEERERQKRVEREAEAERARAAQLAEALNEQIRVDAQKHQQAKEQQMQSRKRANSETTEVPIPGETPTETFNSEISFKGVVFNSVKIFHPRNEGLGTAYLADPVCDDINVTLPLEVLVYTFESSYYSSNQGKRKLKQVESDIRRLSAIRHPNLLSVLAVKLHLSHSQGPSQLVILTEQRPALSLQDILEDCQSLREERASAYLAQILSALNAVHTGDLVHRGISTRCIGIASQEEPSQQKLVKLGNVVFYTRLLDLHRSNPFGSSVSPSFDEPRMPDAWYCKDVKNDSALSYTRHRDIHAVGIVLLQMLIGHDVMERFEDPQAALQYAIISPSLQQHAMNMLLPKKSVSCITLLADLASTSFHSHQAQTRTPSIPSPEMDYFKAPMRSRHTSRWKEDWEELELLGKGAFGSVVKARNKIDSRIYAVKKVRLRTMQSDSKIFREVNALSRLSHRFIVRYYTTWVEASEPVSTAASDSESSDSGTEYGISVAPSQDPFATSNHSDGISIDLNDLDVMHRSLSRSTSFPSIHFTHSSEKGEDESDNSSSSDGVLGLEPLYRRPTPNEFVERQTLKERVDEGISEDEAWRLFQQIVDALVHMSSLGILHRDIKLTNIFIGKSPRIESKRTSTVLDGKGDCKVGDFGLATSSLAAVDPSDVSRPGITMDSEMTLEVGTRLYIAPEVQSRKRGPRNHTKADMYSLGIVFFEMNFFFATGAERIAVIENIRKPEVIFPPSWDPHRIRQKQIITWLLQHDTNERPSAIELSQSPLLPPRLEDEYFRGALRMMTKQDSPHHQAVLSALFNQPVQLSRRFIYDREADLPEHANLNGIVVDRLSSIFRLHGAVDIEPPLLIPVVDPEDEKTHATFLDRHGDIVMLPNDLLTPFARLAVRTSVKRIKRYHITDIYRPNPVAGHPKTTKAAIFDIISPDLTSGPIASAAEIIMIASDLLDGFPSLEQNYDIHVSHSNIVTHVLERIPTPHRTSVLEIINQPKSTPSQRRAALLKKGLLRSVVDELEALADGETDIDALLAKIEKLSPQLFALIQPAVEQVKSTVQCAIATGVSRPIFFHPLMLGAHHTHFKNGVLVEVVRKSKRTDVLAAGGRYDDLITQTGLPKSKLDSSCAFAFQVSVEKITMALATYQSTSLKILVKEQRSFGFWSPRRCDVYVVSYHPGYLQERLEVAAYLWRNGISADIMYESGLTDVGHDDYVETCQREGILFTVYPRPRLQRKDQAAFRIKSILKGTEYDVTRLELVPWLLHQISEQKRVDLSTSGARMFTDITQNNISSKDVATSSDVQMVLPGDAKKMKSLKNMYIDRAFETGVQIKNSFQNGMPMLGVDVTPTVFDSMTKSSTWISDDEAWKPIAADFPASSYSYAQQLREQVRQRKLESHPFLLLYSVRDERVQLVKLS
ncbi:hypothetical protein PLEOSDRAFT_1066383 [Pleurotus ostreatus PC15]|uniref:non-specific serine/threonine protein kinase n=1 Tax=Pleurotus ostreatus (strain PC15) TaxID=1137138 RepID=A0A067NDX5_PLEO1|nr:hypothetical protein PLEOSDRAFT_1066383 [Pleurotus ostreatus PC15]